MVEASDAGTLSKLLPHALIELVTTSESKRARRVLGAYSASLAVAGLAHTYQERRTKRRSYSVSVPAQDSVYPELHAWLVAQTRSAEHHALVARSTQSEIHNPIRVALTTGQNAKVRIGGHAVRVEVEEQAMRAEDVMSGKLTNEKIIFRATSRDARDAVLAWLADMAEQHRRVGPRLNMIDQWGNAQDSTPLAPRLLTSVALPAAQKQRIVGDLEWFLGAEEQHAQLGLPWHRGYLLYGPPGTGKTTMARALATHFNLDLVYFPLANVRGDQVISYALSQMSARSILLLEDIDIIKASHDRGGATSEGLSLQGLLNGLDGVGTPHGLITICTTNAPEKLDSALMRPGRLDVRELLDYVTASTAEDVLDVLSVPNDTLAGCVPFPRNLTPAMLIEAAKPLIGATESQRQAALVACVEDLNAQNLKEEAASVENENPHRSRRRRLVRGRNLAHQAA